MVGRLDHGPVVEVGAAVGEGRGDRGQRQLRARFEGVEQPGGLAPEGGGAAGGEGEESGGGHPSRPFGGGLLFRDGLPGGRPLFGSELLFRGGLLFGSGLPFRDGPLFGGGRLFKGELPFGDGLPFGGAPLFEGGLLFRGGDRWLWSRLGPGSGRCLLQDHVGVGPADPERADPGPAHPAPVARPGLSGAVHVQAAVGPVDVVGEALGVQGRRYALVAEGEDGRDDAGDARGRLGVADAGLHGGDAERPVGGPAGPEHIGQCPQFDGVAERGAGAVGLDVVQVVRGESGRVQGGAQHPLLSRAVGGAQALAAAVLVDRRTLDDGQDPVAVPACVREPLEQDETTALGPHDAVRVGGEGAAPPGRGQPAQPAELDVPARGDQQRGPAGQGEIALPAGQGTRRQVQGDQ